MPKLTHALSLLGVVLCAALARAEPSAPTVTLERGPGKVVFRASNPLTYPITVLVEVDGLENMRSSLPLPAKVVLPAAADRAVVVELSPVDAKSRWRYGRWNYRWQPGSCQARHDERATYQLPYPRGYAYWVVQGYDGAYSHQGKRALDFDLPRGSAIHAARAGRVVRVKQDSDQGGPDPALAKLANQIWILHTDDTIARYLHLEVGGAEVELGQQVRAGQRIGRSGDTGYSKAPHLHFDVFVPDDEIRAARTLPTPFETDAAARVLVEQGQSPMRPFPQSQARSVPLNALRRILFARQAPAEGQPVEGVTHLATGERVHVVLQIGARRRYDVQVTFHRDRDQRPRAVESVTTRPDWDRAWVTHDVNALHLRGRPCRVKVTFDGELVGESEFALEGER